MNEAKENTNTNTNTNNDITQLTLPLPDDFHLHLRDGPTLVAVAPSAAERFARAIIMPNLIPPVTTTEAALQYRQRILTATHSTNSEFIPLMTLYLTDNTPPQEIVRAKESGHIYAVKLYPAGATTNSDSGVTDIQKVIPTLEKMAECGMPLLVHGEVTDQSIDIFDREKVFIEKVLINLIKAVPNLKIVMEHITTKDAVEFVASCGDNVAATITAHHLLFNRNQIFKGGINPHYYCLPILKSEIDRKALLQAATSGSPKYFLGTDSAPHSRNKKECACGSAGCYTSFAAIELYAEAFQSVNALDKLQGFACEFGAQFYNLPLNATRTEKRIKLLKKSWQIPSTYSLNENEDVVPLMANQTLSWSLSQ